MRKGRFLISILIVLSLILPGCQQEVPMADPVAVVEDVEPTATYDWMAGESPVPNKRIGTVRAGLAGADVAVSPTGVYFLPAYTVTSEQYIMYVDDGSDQVIKLCGRLDCTHTDDDCNAYVEDAGYITYDDGYLYVATHGVELINGYTASVSELFRMDPDGSNRVELYDLGGFASSVSEDGEMVEVEGWRLSGGYYEFAVKTWAEAEDGQLQRAGSDGYIYKLDGSEGAPRPDPSDAATMYHCGDLLMGIKKGSGNGGELGSYWAVDLEAGADTYLTDHPGVPGWFSLEEAYYCRNGDLIRLTYATGEEKVVVETGLETKTELDYYALCFPDCFVIANTEFGDDGDDNLYIYNWAFELVDIVLIDVPHEGMTHRLFLAETADRFILTDGTVGDLPLYYINKSELGTGNVQIHEFQLPDLRTDFM